MTAPTYLDASAMVKLVLREEGSDSVVEYVADRRECVSSVVAAVEAPRAVLRRAPSAGPRVAAMLETVDLVRLEAGILRRAAALPPLDLRALDAIHIATAIELGEVEAFVTYDDRQAEAARSLGLPVVSPGRDPAI